MQAILLLCISVKINNIKTIVEKIIRIGSIFSIGELDTNKYGIPILAVKESILNVKGTPQQIKWQKQLNSRKYEEINLVRDIY